MWMLILFTCIQRDHFLLSFLSLNMFINFFTWNTCDKLFFCNVCASVSLQMIYLIQGYWFVACMVVNRWLTMSNIQILLQFHLDLYLILHVYLLFTEELYQSFYHPISGFVQWRLSCVTSPFGAFNLPVGIQNEV